MPKNKVQFHPGYYSLTDLFKNYGTEDQCVQAILFKWHWPEAEGLPEAEGFSCPECSKGSYCTLKTRKLYQCNHCHHQTSLISGAIFEQKKSPLTTWFLAMYLISQAKTGVFSLVLMRQLGVSCNTTGALRIKSCKS